MFELMNATLNMTYKALRKGARMEWQCTSCGHQLDGDVMHNKPDLCPVCGGTEFEDAEDAEKREAENRAINKKDEYLEDR